MERYSAIFIGMKIGDVRVTNYLILILQINCEGVSLPLTNLTMTKKQLYVGIFLMLFTVVGNTQEAKNLFKGSYLSFELNYRSYGTNDHVGFGGGLEFSKDLKKWLGVGVNISYWSNDDLDWDFVNPFYRENFSILW